MAEPLPPVNVSMLAHATDSVRAVLASADRGDEVAQRMLLRFAAAPALEASLRRIVTAADALAPTLDELKDEKASYSYDAQQLRFAVNGAQEALWAAAGRAVVLPIAEHAGDDEAAA